MIAVEMCLELRHIISGSRYRTRWRESDFIMDELSKCVPNGDAFCKDISPVDILVDGFYCNCFCGMVR